MIGLVVILYLHIYDVSTKCFIPYGLFAYITVIPLGLQSFLGSVDTLIMPQATTPAIEISFYMLLPWILRIRLLSLMMATASIIIFVGSARGFWPENIYKYYTTPGSLIFFIMGSFICRREWGLLALVLSVMITTFIYCYPRHFEIDYMIGLVVGLPATIMLRRFPANTLDSALGNASYGCYLGHVYVFSTVEWLLGIKSVGLISGISLIILACFFGHLSFIPIEHPTMRFGKRLGSAV